MQRARMARLCHQGQEAENCVSMFLMGSSWGPELSNPGVAALGLGARTKAGVH